MATLREMLSPRYTTRYEDLLQVKWQVYPDFHIPDVMEPQPHRMQERAAASWRSFDSASIEWLPVAADFTCSGRLYKDAYGEGFAQKLLGHTSENT
ncbi:hypothetical protein, partial [Salmonella enterica]|uniref:hypothetical protein n=1 Tax=Salmonella enterica TaxID=28901 RepID=UPI001E32DE80